MSNKKRSVKWLQLLVRLLIFVKVDHPQHMARERNMLNNSSPTANTLSWKFDKKNEYVKTLDIWLQRVKRFFLKLNWSYRLIIIIIIIIIKTVEHESDDYTNCNGGSLYSHQRIGKGTRGLRNNKTSGDHPNYCIIEIGQNCEESPEGLTRLTITQTPVQNHQLTLM